jgi:hypothetical protein
MKTLIVLFLLAILYFVPAKNGYWNPPLKGFDTLTTVHELPYSVDSIHQWFNDIGSLFSVRYPGLYQYSLSGRNFNVDTLFIDLYKIEHYQTVDSVRIDTLWNDTSFTVIYDTAWINHYDININEVDTTLLYGFNRTISEVPFYVDTLGECNLRWYMKDTPYKVFKQINKN